MQKRMLLGYISVWLCVAMFTWSLRYRVTMRFYYFRMIYREILLVPNGEFKLILDQSIFRYVRSS